MRLSLLGKADDDEAHQDSVWTCAWTTKGDLLLTGSVDETVNAYKEVDHKVKRHHNFTGHTLGVICIATDVSGEYAATSSLDSSIRVWSLDTLDTKDVIETNPSETWAVCFNPASESLQIAAAGGSNNNIALYNCDQTHVPISSLSLPVVGDAFSTFCILFTSRLSSQFIVQCYCSNTKHSRESSCETWADLCSRTCSLYACCIFFVLHMCRQMRSSRKTGLC